MARQWFLAPLTTLAIVGLALVTISATVTFSSTFKSMDAGRVSFAGRKVAAVVISADESLRVAGEESLVRELGKYAVHAVASYRIVPKEELRRAETARPWFEKANVEGMVIVRPVVTDTRQTYTPAMWVSTNYGTPWNYYGYGWSAVLVGASSQLETRVVVETTVYSLPLNQLVWATVTETRNPRNLQGFVEELVTESVKAMQKQGLAKRQPR
jgi:hypothetical protein